MTLPDRLQRSRRQKLPRGTVCVTRPGKWGNPFKFERRICGHWWVYHCEKGDAYWPERCYKHKADAAAQAVRAYRLWLRESNEGRLMAALARRDLAGKDLACWCQPGEPCHADVLIEIANGEAGKI